MHPKELRINRKIEEWARAWENKEAGLLTGAQLWHAVRWCSSKSGRAAGLSDLALEFVKQSYVAHKKDYDGTARLRDICRGCGVEYRSENLLICVQCSRERCGACASRGEINEYGDAVCICGGIMV